MIVVHKADIRWTYHISTQHHVRWLTVETTAAEG